MKLPINVIAVLFLVASGAGLGTQWLFDRESHGVPNLPEVVTHFLSAEGFQFTGRKPLSRETATAGYFFETPDCRLPLIIVPVASPEEGSFVQWTYGAAHDKSIFFLYQGAVTETFPEASYILGEAWRAGLQLWQGDAAASDPVLTIVRDRQCGRHATVDWQRLDVPQSSTL